MDQPGTLPNLVAFADPGGKPFGSVLYRSFVMVSFKVADPEDFVGVVHELSAIFRHWLNAGLGRRDRQRAAFRSFRCIVAKCSCYAAKVEPAVMSRVSKFQHTNGGNERIAVAVVRLPEFTVGAHDDARTFVTP
jgi:hypothetical protein